MEALWNVIQIIFSEAGNRLNCFIGRCDNLTIALILFMIADYFTGVMCSIFDKKLLREIGFKGICRKILMFIIVEAANILDVRVLGTISALKTTVLLFYLSHEGISILTNAEHMGLPISKKLREVLKQSM